MKTLKNTEIVWGPLRSHLHRRYSCIRKSEEEWIGALLCMVFGFDNESDPVSPVQIEFLFPVPHKVNIRHAILRKIHKNSQRRIEIEKRLRCKFALPLGRGDGGRERSRPRNLKKKLEKSDDIFQGSIFSNNLPEILEKSFFSIKFSSKNFRIFLKISQKIVFFVQIRENEPQGFFRNSEALPKIVHFIYIFHWSFLKNFSKIRRSLTVFLPFLVLLQGRQNLTCFLKKIWKIY